MILYCTCRFYTLTENKLTWISNKISPALFVISIDQLTIQCTRRIASHLITPLNIHVSFPSLFYLPQNKISIKLSHLLSLFIFPIHGANIISRKSSKAIPSCIQKLSRWRYSNYFVPRGDDMTAWFMFPFCLQPNAKWRVYHKCTFFMFLCQKSHQKRERNIPMVSCTCTFSRIRTWSN